MSEKTLSEIAELAVRTAESFDSLDEPVIEKWAEWAGGGEFTTDDLRTLANAVLSPTSNQELMSTLHGAGLRWQQK